MLNTEIVLDRWTKTYNSHRKPDRENIFPYYHENIIFRNSIQCIEEKEKFVDMCNSLATRSKELNMEIANSAQQENVIMPDWKMNMTFKRYPSIPLYGATG